MLDDREFDCFTVDSNNDTVKRVLVKNSSSDPVPVVYTPDTSRLIYNISLLATVETSLVLPVNTMEYNIRARGNSELKLYFVSGGANYYTIPKNNSFSDDKFSPALTIYFESNMNDTVEVVCWYLTP